MAGKKISDLEVKNEFPKDCEFLLPVVGLHCEPLHSISMFQICEIIKGHIGKGATVRLDQNLDGTISIIVCPAK